MVRLVLPSYIGRGSNRALNPRLLEGIPVETDLLSQTMWSEGEIRAGVDQEAKAGGPAESPYHDRNFRIADRPKQRRFIA